MDQMQCCIAFVYSKYHHNACYFMAKSNYLNQIIY